MLQWRRNFIVNAPGFFSLIWRVAEPMLSPTTRRKIRLLHNKQVLNGHTKLQIGMQKNIACPLHVTRAGCITLHFIALHL